MAALLKTPTTNLGTCGSGQPPSKRLAGGHGTNLKDETEFMSDDWVSETGKDYGPAVRRWEAVTGNPVPAPTEPGQRTAKRLSARFAEWMMGLPAGWVTGTPGLKRTEQFRCIGNGVVPQQAEAAFRHLMADWPTEPKEN